MNIACLTAFCCSVPMRGVLGSQAGNFSLNDADMLIWNTSLGS